MLSLRFSPLHELKRELNGMRGQFDQMLGDLRLGARSFAPATYPALNGWEVADGYWFEAELPGIALQDLEIYVTDRNSLTIKGNRQPVSNEGGTWQRRERGHGTFERELTLPGYVDAEQVEASLKNGVLTVKLPKAAEMRSRKIEVKAS